MKKTVQLFFLLLIAHTDFAQTPDKGNVKKTFALTQNYSAAKCDGVGDNVSTASILQQGFLFKVVAVTPTHYVIQVLEWSNEDNPNNALFVEIPEVKAVKAQAAVLAVPAVAAVPGQAARPAVDAVVDSAGTVISLSQPARPAVDAVTAQPAIPAQPAIAAQPAQAAQPIYFQIAEADFKNVCEKPVSNHSFTVGIPTIPAKLRFGNKGRGDDPKYFQFEGNVSLGLSGGYKFSWGENMDYGVNVLGGFTVASVQVDSMSTKGKVTAPTAAASFSPHFGLAFDFKKFQVGIYTGIDFLYGSVNKDWVYRNKPWFGIGVGYSLLKVGAEAKN